MNAPGSSSASTLWSTRTRTLLIVSLVVIVAVVAAVLLAARTGDEHHADARPGGAASTATSSAKARTGFHLVVDSLGIDAPIVSISLGSDRVLDPPANAQEVGWWNDSAKPGAPSGQTIITGHTVHTGGGQLDHLGTMKRGATVRLVTAHHGRSYRVTKVFTLTKDEVTKRSVALFGQTRKHNRLVLITCDDWTGSEYLKNVFVYAEPLPKGASDSA